ncbi:hypothetical protein [Halomontanus rarus]|uniref:hypothetical protein n=1 Tax=Halomontanus rarus TaxID=3034020 RepID=UPI0023E87C47|nr:hypothetical protein [Halovivax sp. TS33]
MTRKKEEEQYTNDSLHTQTMTDQHVTFSRRGGPPDAPKPEPSSAHIPEWFRTLNQSIDSLPIPVDKTAKLCMPLNDAMRLGWMLRAPATITLRERGGTLEVSVGDDRNGDGTDDVEDDGRALAPDPADLVTTFDVDQPDADRNSAFLLPDCTISTPWTIDTPQGYSTLLTHPLNRDEMRFTVSGMLAETDAYDDPIRVPIHLEAETVTIEAGEPIAQVIPVDRRDIALPTAAKPFSDDPNLRKAHIRCSEASTRRKDVYRKDAWVPKSTPRIVSDPGEADSPDSDGGASRGEGKRDGDGDGEGEGERDGNPSSVAENDSTDDDPSLTYYCFDERYESLPNPSPASEYVLEGYEDELRKIDGLDAEQPTTDWLLAAMAIGAIVPLPERLTVRRRASEAGGAGRGGGRNSTLELESPGEEDRHHSQNPLKMGEDHPLAPVTLLNVNSEWVIDPPENYSVLICSPFNHFQRYYRAYAGLGDFDRYPTTANTPGLFTGRADERSFPAEMPVAQHVPLNRDRILHTATIVDETEDEAETENEDEDEDVVDRE